MRARRGGPSLTLPLLVPTKLRRVDVFQPLTNERSTAGRNQTARIQELDYDFFWIKSLMAKRFEEAPYPLHARIMSKEQPQKRMVTKDNE